MNDDGNDTFQKDFQKEMMKQYAAIFQQMPNVRTSKKSFDFKEIAHVVMKALEDEGKADFVLLKHDNVREWWEEVKEQERKDLVKAKALAKLNEEERVLLGIKE